MYRYQSAHCIWAPVVTRIQTFLGTNSYLSTLLKVPIYTFYIHPLRYQWTHCICTPWRTNLLLSTLLDIPVYMFCLHSLSYQSPILSILLEVPMYTFYLHSFRYQSTHSVHIPWGINLHILSTLLEVLFTHSIYTAICIILHILSPLM